MTSRSSFANNFFLVLALALGSVLLVRVAPLSAGLFADPTRRAILDKLPADEIASAKFRYAQTKPPYPIGLFGNSRIEMIGCEEIGLPRGHVFNFAIGGQSIRQSIRLLEQLQAIGKAPAFAVISMDHVELGMPGGGSAFPQPPVRWLHAMSDAVTTARNRSVRAAGVGLYNATAFELQSIKLAFNSSYLTTKITGLLQLRSGANFVRDDGSRITVSEVAPRMYKLPDPRADDYAELESDLILLAQIRDRGVRILLYESPLAPQIADAAEINLSSKARAVRQRLIAQCRQLKLDCLAAPALPPEDWPDANHAPAGSLGSWLKERIGSS